MSNDQLLLIITAIGIVIPASVTFAVGFLTYRNNSAKQRLDETNAKFDALKDMVTLSREEIDRLKAELKELRLENAELRHKVEMLEFENSGLRATLDEQDGSYKHLKAWAEELVGAMKSHDIPVPPMPDRESTRPRPR